MQHGGKIKHAIAYKWFSYLLVIAFAYYWIFTIAMIFVPKQLKSGFPRQASAYNAFLRQNWHLFSVTKFYNRQLNLVIRDTANRRPTDTINLVAYSAAEKKKYAPFNNYEDAMDHLLYLEMNALEVQLQQKIELLNKRFPHRPDSFYIRQASLLVEKDSLQQLSLQNLYNYAGYVLKQKNISTSGKLFELNLTHKFIPPQQPKYNITADGRSELYFTSTFKSF